MTATFLQPLQGVLGIGTGNYERGIRFATDPARGELWAGWTGNMLALLAGATIPANAAQPQAARYKLDLTSEDTFYPPEYGSPIPYPRPNEDVARCGPSDVAMNASGDLCFAVGQQRTESGSVAGYNLFATIRSGRTGFWGKTSLLGYLGSPSEDGSDEVENEAYEVSSRGIVCLTLRDGDFLVVALSGSRIYQWRYFVARGAWSARDLLFVGSARQFKHAKLSGAIDTANRLHLIFDEFVASPGSSSALRWLRFLPDASPTSDQEELIAQAETPFIAGSYYPAFPAFVIDPLDPDRMDVVHSWKNDAQDIARLLRRRNETWESPVDLWTPAPGTHTRPDPDIAIDDRGVRHIAYCRRAGLSIRAVYYRSLTVDGVLGDQVLVSTTVGVDFAGDATRHPGAELPAIGYHARYSLVVIGWDEQTSLGAIPRHSVRFAYSRDAVTGSRIEVPQFQVDCFAIGCLSNSDAQEAIDLQETPGEGLGVRRTPWW